ncbi:DUF6940 family protein [Fodinibius halophilus]|uniref:Uncharacterized protein n=1 Tax=Fodinibius halophilus TaxID=1736908 RepID=A0A6M1TCC0_9BACT|nr:hypothetical protein [Fodinibius halophilus]NGP87872.1 hypothetical protein [Fodinibius halophilus]
MYKADRTELEATAPAIKFQIYDSDKAILYQDFLFLLQRDEAFRSFLIELLAEVPFRAYHWECPPLNKSIVDQPFEFVVTRTPGIDLPPDPGPFRSYFNDSYTDEGIAVFDNLGKDAKLIAPEPVAEGLNYSHIGVFLEEAPVQQQHTLWEKVGAVVQDEISDQPIWLNTAGGGVAWLHVRLDSRPKYYRCREYKEMRF